MKKRNIPIILGTFLLTAGTFFALALAWSHKKVESPADLINISELSEEFMEDYFSSFAETNQTADVNSTIIVTSTEKPGNTFGATKMIEAPNNQYFLYYNSPSEKESAMRKIQKEPGILYIEEDSLFEASDYNSWGIEAMGLNQAIANFDIEGSEQVTVAIIDSGCDMDIFNNNFEGKIQETYNLYDSYMHDSIGHGTHIAGTIAESTPNNVKILPVKVSDSKNMPATSIITAINYINYYHKADVINMSFGRSYGNDDYGKSEYIAIQAATDNNIVSVAATGNDSSSTVNYPAAFDNTIAVAAVDSNKEHASFSNHGPSVTFAAPGVNILSINGTKDGTSMATPHVVSAIAILKSTNKDLSMDQTIEILKNSVVDLGEPGRDDYYGYGLIDMSQYSTLKAMTEETSIADFEIADTSAIRARFGNITNLMNIGIRLIDQAGNYYDKLLGDLDGLEVTGYDAFSEGDQEILVAYKGISKYITVNNGVGGGDTSAYYVQPLNDNEAVIEDAFNAPRRVYIPESINGYTIVALGKDVSFFFGQLDNAEYIVLPNSVREIKKNAFKNRENLKSVRGGADFVSVGDSAFYGTYRLAEFEPGLSYVGDSAFYNNRALRTLTLSDGVESISAYAFAECSNLENLNIPNNITEIGEYALSKTNLNSLSIPASLVTIGENAFKDISGLETITVEPENPVYDSRDHSNTLIETATNTIILGSSNTTIPSSVVSIAAYAFFGNQKIQEVHTNNIERIGVAAFAGCINLKRFYIENDELFLHGSLYDTFYYSPAGYEKIPNLVVYATTDSGNEDTVENELQDQGVQAYIITASLEVEVSADQDYVAFQNASNVNITANYDGFAKNPYSLIETIENYTIEYQNGDSLRAGDTLFTIKGTTQYGESFEQPFNVSVSKVIPTYEIPTGLTAALGQTLSEIELPEGFEWTNSSQTIDELGEIAYAARYIPSDTNNYEIVENINITLSVINAKTIIHPEIIIEDKIYDGLNTIPNDLITVSNLDSFEYSILSANSSGANVGIETATIKLKLTDEKYEDFSFDDNKQEQDFAIQFNIIPKKIAKPTKPDGYYTYNTEEITFAVLGYDEESMTISGNKGTNAGLYATIISLKNNNYTWDDNTIDDITLQYEIKKAKLSVTDNSSDKTVVLDNTPHTINISLEYPSGTHIKYEDSNGDYVLDQIPEYTEVGEYTIRYKLYIDENYTEYFGEHTLTILSDFIVNFDKDVTVQDDTIIAKPEDTFSAIASKIHTTPSDNSFEHHDKDDNIIDSETIKTGDKIKIIVDDYEQEYSIAVLGDTDGNGAITDADYLSIKNDIMDIEKLSGVYKKAADINGNNKIDIIDYIRVKKIIMGGNL